MWGKAAFSAVNWPMGSDVEKENDKSSREHDNE